MNCFKYENYYLGLFSNVDIVGNGNNVWLSQSVPESLYLHLIEFNKRSTFQTPTPPKLPPPHPNSPAFSEKCSHKILEAGFIVRQ